MNVARYLTKTIGYSIYLNNMEPQTYKRKSWQGIKMPVNNAMLSSLTILSENLDDLLIMVIITLSEFFLIFNNL